MSNKADKYIRMKLRDYWRIRRYFPAHRGESLADYFKRVADFLQKIDNTMGVDKLEENFKKWK